MKAKFALTAIFLSCFTILKLNAQNFQWTRSAGSSMYDFIADQVTDDNGNTYICGQFQLAANFGSQTVSSAGSDDIFVAKYNKNGELKWVKKAGGTGWDRANDICVDSKGNVFIVGWIGYTAFFGSGHILKDPQAFIAKYDSSGNIQWAKNLSSQYYYYYYYNNGDNLVIDKNDKLYISGSFSGDSIRLGKVKLSGYGQIPVTHFLAQVNNDGEVQWAKGIASSKYYGAGGYYYYHGISIALDRSGGLFITGRYSGDMEIGKFKLVSSFNIKNPNSPTYQKLGIDVFVARLTPDGEVLWAKNASGNTFYYYWGGYYYNYFHQGTLAVDDDKNVYIGGGFGDTMLFGNRQLVSKGGLDAYFAKYDSSGNFKWVKQYGGDFDDLVSSVQIKNKKEVCFAGTYFYQANFDNVSLTNDNGNNAFIAVADSSGNLKSIKEPVASNGTSRVYHLTKDIAGNFYLSGVFQGKMTLGPDTIVNNTYDDMFISKFGVCNVPPSLTAAGVVSICSGDSVSLSVKNIYSNYRWYNSGEEIKGATGNTVYAKKSGIYRVVVDSGLCSGVSNAIEVNVSKKANLGGDKELCLGGSVILNPGNYSAYLWSDGSNKSTLFVNKTGKFYVRVTDDKGCVSTDTAIITFNSPPDPEIIATPKSTVCPGDTIILRTSIPFAEYQWYRNGQPMFGMTADKIKVTVVGDYSVKVKNLTGCYNSDTILVRNTQLTPPAILSSGPLAFCQGGQVILNVTSGYKNYRWFRNGSPLMNSTTEFLKVNGSGQYTVYVDSGGCQVMSQPANVNVYPYPEPNLPDSFVLCRDKEAELDAGSGFASYNWSTGDTTQKLKITNSGLYILRVKNAFGCEAVDSVRVKLNGILSAEILKKNDTLFASPATQYQWYFEDVKINGATENYYIPMFDGNYTVVVFDEYGCASTSAVKYFESKNTYKPGQPLELKIYPNPAVDAVTVQFYFGPNVNVDAKISLHDALGKKLAEHNETLNSNFTQKIRLNMQGYSEGVYYLSVRLNDFSTVKKVIKVKP